MQYGVYCKKNDYCTILHVVHSYSCQLLFKFRYVKCKMCKGNDQFSICYFDRLEGFYTAAHVYCRRYITVGHFAVHLVLIF